MAMMLGKASMDVFPKMGTLGTASELDSSSATFQLEGDAVGVMAGEVLYVVGWLVALIMWGFGLAWLFLAVASISRSRFPFNMGWWGFTFPIGVYAMSTMTLGRKMPSLFFEVSGIVSLVDLFDVTSERALDADFGPGLSCRCHSTMDGCDCWDDMEDIHWRAFPCSS